MQQITLDNAVQLIEATRETGQVFTIHFYKKDGTLRKMNSRLGVKKHLAGGSLAFDARSKGLLPVFDMQKKNYRMINLKTITALTINNINYIVE